MTELLAAIPLAPALTRAQREFSADGLVVGYGPAEGDLAELAPWSGPCITPFSSSRTAALVCCASSATSSRCWIGGTLPPLSLHDRGRDRSRAVRHMV
jgi:hypothetical protein